VACGGLVAGGAVLAGAAQTATSAPSAQQDERILTYLLGVEELQAAFYTDAVERKRLTGESAEFARVAQDHERMHVSFLREALGADAPRVRSYDFAEATSSDRAFLEAAVELEEIGLAAYLGAAPNLRPGTLRDAAKVLSVEARHAAWARDLAGRNPAPRASDEGLSEAQIKARLRDKGFA
jgi:hypothetical protein